MNTTDGPIRQREHTTEKEDQLVKLCQKHVLRHVMQDIQQGHMLCLIKFLHVCGLAIW